MHRTGYLGMLLALGITCAHAGAIDPRIIITPDAPAPQTVTTATFQFASDAAGGGTPTFLNATGFDWTEISFTVTLPSGETFQCGAPGLYAQCSAGLVVGVAAADPLYFIDFTGPAPGILDDQTFTITLNDGTTDGGSWGPNNTITANVTFAPEPGSWLLFLSGAALIVPLRRYCSRSRA